MVKAAHREVERAAMLIGFLAGHEVSCQESDVSAKLVVSSGDKRHRHAWSTLHLRRTSDPRRTETRQGRFVEGALFQNLPGMMARYRSDEDAWDSALFSYLHSRRAPLQARFLLLATSLETAKAHWLGENELDFRFKRSAFDKLRRVLSTTLTEHPLAKDVSDDVKRDLVDGLLGLNRPSFAWALREMSRALEFDISDQLNSDGSFLFVPIRNALVHNGTFPKGCHPWVEVCRLQALVERVLAASLGLKLRPKLGLGSFR